MRVGFVGLGKLGLPVAYAMAAKGLEVYGYDLKVSADHGFRISGETDAAQTIQDAKDRMHFSPLSEVVQKCDLIFVAVQTPHEPRFEGITPLTEERADFDYSFLRSAVASIDNYAFQQGRHITLAIISTVLPGTIRREVLPLLSRFTTLAYNPSFIAMGTTIPDFLDPEFVLIGREEIPSKLYEVYKALGLGNRIRATSIEDAEVIKVAYNTFIGLKIVFANTLMEVCHKTPGANVDEVTDALFLASRRLISSAYMEGGMGDGGACHPRDNIALSWLARDLDLSHDIFEDVMRGREQQARWLLALVMEHSLTKSLPLGILGITYKPGSSIETGSAARLIEYFMGKPTIYDPHAEPYDEWPTDDPHVWLVGTKHPEFADLKLPQGSVVIDPWRYIPEQEGVRVIHVGIGAAADNRQAEDGRKMRALAS